MLVFAASEIELSQTQGDGSSAAAHTKLASKFFKKEKQKLAIKCPKQMQYLWAAYLEMKSGEDAVNFTVINAWCNVRNKQLLKFEIDALIQIERMRVRQQIKSLQNKKNKT